MTNGEWKLPSLRGGKEVGEVGGWEEEGEER